MWRPGGWGFPNLKANNFVPLIRVTITITGMDNRRWLVSLTGNCDMWQLACLCSFMSAGFRHQEVEVWRAQVMVPNRHDQRKTSKRIWRRRLFANLNQGLLINCELLASSCFACGGHAEVRFKTIIPFMMSGKSRDTLHSISLPNASSPDLVNQAGTISIRKS